MALGGRIEEVLAQLGVLEEAQKAQLEALAGGTGDLGEYVATMAERAALDDVLELLRQRQQAAGIARLQKAEESAATTAAQARLAMLMARQERDAMLTERRVFLNNGRMYTPNRGPARLTIEHELVDAQEKLLAAEYESKAASAAWEQARQELDAAL